MEKLLKQYEEFTQTLSPDEIAYLKTLDPRKLVGGMNFTGLKNSITSYRTIHQPDFWEHIFTKYKDMILEACYADEIIYVNNQSVKRIRKDVV